MRKLVITKRTSRTLTNLPFRLLDNLDTLRTYRWASYVHNFLISSLNRSSIVYREKSNDHTIFVSSSVVVVQVWACQRISLGDIIDTLAFPRFLSLSLLRMRGERIKNEKKKKKSELLEKLNANSKFLVEMKEDLERMKRYFYSRAATQGFDEEHPAGSDAVGVSGGRDDALHVNAEEGNIEADNTAAADAQRNANAIDSEQILVDATNEIDEAVEVVVASKLESTNIGATSQSKNGASHGSPEVPTFGIEEAKNTTERAPSAEEEKTVEEHKDAIDSSLSDDALIIICDEQGHASLYEVVEAMLKEEKVMNIEVGYENPDSLAIAPYVKPSSPFTQPIVMLSIFFAAGHFMYKEKCQTESISRDKVICNCAKRKVNRRLMAPVLHNNHWWCYVLH
ncbi:hypothetical protein DEO72_LG2g3456 [Vigna unguiculata]|uniref:Uncharacterized protein n=1 Tax=Vigna unguiculata TaxID=3917 RepID=A0A4D6L3M9_VIGUN|nr:hypothetical protein DEO72_LG2g3456 [Vigna unguiculata]